MKLRLYSMALLAGLFAFTACSDDDNNDDKQPETNATELKGTITSDVTLKSGNTYKLNGEYIVKAGATLKIEPGVTIEAVDDNVVDFILIEQGAKIDAQGTADQPIVMTSELKKDGAWGGLHLCGKAHTNLPGGTGNSEIGGATYGGNVENDNSGTLRYIRLEYTGYAFDEEHEANGISFYGVGSGTTVDHCEAYKGSDDGFEFFGGSVNISNMVVVSCSDDSFDWTEGWNGTATNLVAYQESKATLGYDCDCLIEADNYEKDFKAEPVSHPKLSNLILVGNGESGQGVRLRRGTMADIDNAKVCGKGKPLTVESEETETFLKDGESVLKNVTISAAVNSEKGIYTNDVFTSQTGNTVDTSLSYSNFDAVKTAAGWISGNWVK